jgi:site-specific DNA-methyltransferase (adenine-specific)
MVVQGDCAVEIAKLPTSVCDLVVCDPPYNIGFDYGDGEYEDSKEAHEYIDWCKLWLTQVKRLLKPDGSLWLMIGDAFVSELDILCKKMGFHKRSQVVWHFTFGVNSVKKFTPSHTQLLYYVCNPKKFTFNAESVRVPSARALQYADKRAHPDGRLPDDTWIIRPQKALDYFPAEADTWLFSRIAGTFKQRAGTPNQIPEQLLGRIIRTCSNPGDLVCDPMMGSGSTLAVAKKLGRRYLGFDISPAFVRCAERRVDEAKEGEALDGPLPHGG